MYLSVIIPYFNEDNIIEHNILQIIEYFEFKFSFEIIIVNDSGKKNSNLEKLNNTFNFITLINNNKNFGKGFSIRSGVLSSKSKLILITDADMSTPIDEFEKLHKYYDDYSVIIGSRNIPESKIGITQPFYRKISGRIYNLLTKIILNLDFHDTQCGFKLFDSKALKKIINLSKSNRFGIDLELIYFSRKNNYLIKEVGVRWDNNRFTSVSLFKDSIKMFYEIILLKFR